MISNIRKYYLYEILSGMFFSVPIMVLFWQENGLSLTQVMVLQSIFSIVVVGLEVPTGYFADIFGRRKSLMLGAFFWGIGIIVYSLGFSFYVFLIAELAMALAISFRSGADSAYVYDVLVDNKQEDKYQKIWGHAVFIRVLAMALSAVIGGFIAKYDFRWTFYLTIPFAFFQLPVIFLLKEPIRHKIIIQKNYLFKLFKIIKTSIIQNPKLRWLMIYAGVIYAFNQSALWLYQPYFKLTGLDVVYFGLIFASFNLISAFTSKYAYKLEKILGQKYSLILLVFLVGSSYLLMSNFIFLFSFSFCFLQQFVRGFYGIVMTDYVNKLTTSGIRATVLSAQSLMGRLFYAMIIPVIGYIADVYTLIQALLVLGFTVLILGMFSLLMLKKVKVI